MTMLKCLQWQGKAHISEVNGLNPQRSADKVLGFPRKLNHCSSLPPLVTLLTCSLITASHEISGKSNGVLTREAVAVGVDLAVAVGGCPGDDGHLPVGGDLLDAVDLPLVGLGDVEHATVGHGDGPGRLQGGVHGHPAEQEMVHARHLAVDGAPRHDAHAPALRDLQHDVIVQHVQGIVQGVHGQVCGPLQPHLGKRAGEKREQGWLGRCGSFIQPAPITSSRHVADSQCGC